VRVRQVGGKSGAVLSRRESGKLAVSRVQH
jgi:hypothetical protein